MVKENSGKILYLAPSLALIKQTLEEWSKNSKTQFSYLCVCSDKSVDLIAEDIRLAIKDLSGLFGNVDIEEILDIIFSDYCIGK